MLFFALFVEIRAWIMAKLHKIKVTPKTIRIIISIHILCALISSKSLSLPEFRREDDQQGNNFQTPYQHSQDTSPGLKIR